MGLTFHPRCAHLRNSGIIVMGVTKCSLIGFEACFYKPGEKPMVRETLDLSIELYIKYTYIFKLENLILEHSEIWY